MRHLLMAVCLVSSTASAESFMVKFTNIVGMDKWEASNTQYTRVTGYPVASPGGYLWAAYEMPKGTVSSMGDVTYRINKMANVDKGIIYAEPAYPVSSNSLVPVLGLLAGCTTPPAPTPTPEPTPVVTPTPEPTPIITPTPEPTPALPTDPLLNNLWGFPAVRMSGAWAAGATGKSVKVAVIDSGAETGHPDLVGQITKTYDLINNSTAMIDPNGHGTHCAGTIAAAANNVGVVGAAYKAELRAYRFLDENGSGTTADAVLAIKRAIDDGADILSNSWGGGSFSQALGDIIEVASKKGILFVVAAGNYSSDNDRVMNYPSNDSSTNVLAVCATDKNDALASFSNFGQTKVHVCAPGVNIMSTYKAGKYAYLSGTSMATPLVAGVAALIKGQRPDWTGQQIKAHIINNARKVGALVTKNVAGGIVDASKL